MAVKPIRMPNGVFIHIGKKAPKGYREISAVHLGRGIWMIRLERMKT